jgi:phage shock protein E
MELWQMIRLAWMAILASVSFTVLAGQASAQRNGGGPDFTSDSLKKIRELVEEEKAVLVDVRDLVEWNDGHITGAIHLPWRDLQESLDEKKVRDRLPKDKIVYTYCAVGYRSIRAGKILAKYGYEVRPLKPGYEELVKAGFKSEKK